MTELVRRGLDSLPSLLSHLNDDRPTGILWNPPLPNRREPSVIWGGPFGLGDIYDPRYPGDRLRFTDVNTAAIGGYRKLPSGQYRFRVADLCYAAIGQIVNRSLRPTGEYFSGNSYIINGTSLNSPIEFPSLANAARRDWGNLNQSEFRQSLAVDAEEQYLRVGSTNVHAWGGVQRLIYYYPSDGERLAARLLRRKLTGADLMKSAKAGEAAYMDQLDVLSELEPFGWDGLNELIYNVYRDSVSRPHNSFEDLLYSTRLALQCAKRLVGEGHDDEFREYFVGQIKLENDSLLTPAGRAYRYAIGQDSKIMQDFLAVLDRQKT